MTQKLFYSVAGLILGIALALVVVAILLSRSDEVTTLASIQAFSPAAILVSALIALFLYRENVKKNQADQSRKNSTSYLNEAKQLLERAFDIFVKDGTNLPSNDNRDWRTVALLLLKSQEIEIKITEPDHKKAFSGHKQYFAVQFHRALWSNIDDMDLNYFMPSGNPSDTKTISRIAIAVIFEFAHSIANDYQILDDIDSAPIFASSSVPVEFLGVENLLGKYQELWERVQQLKNGQGDNS